MSKPSNYAIYPWSSVLENSQAETIAKNIMCILNRTGNEWRDLTWDEYVKERKKDGNFTEAERKYFDKVIGYCKSADTAMLFSPEWNK